MELGDGMLVIRAQYLVTFLKDRKESDIQPVLDVDNLKDLCPDGEHETYQQEKYQHVRTPDKTIQQIIDVCDYLYDIFHIFLLQYV